MTPKYEIFNGKINGIFNNNKYEYDFQFNKRDKYKIESNQ